jgi:5-methylcytosine-specific restriction protein A
MVRFDRELRHSLDWADWERNKAHFYAIEFGGQHYPVKQIVSIATGTPVSEFSGGRAPGDANRYVADRGFTIIELRRRNPTWVRDELILALDMYLRFGGNPPGKGSAEIEELSEALNRLGLYLGIATRDRFRNANGVYMKLMNFRRFDPSFTQAGKSGLSHGGRAEEEAWNEFVSHAQRCHEAAEAIRQVLVSMPEGETIANDPMEPEIAEAEEGRVVTVMHLRHERNATLIKARKQSALAKLGTLACEACGFDFHTQYGERGEGFIECHHAKPVHTLRPGEKTKLTDLHLLCANCHRMVHAKRPWLTIEQLTAALGG